MSSASRPRSQARAGLEAAAWVAFLSVMLGFGVGWLLFEPNSPLNKHGALACTCQWARLNPPPPGMDIHVKTKGGPFTREFTVTFRGSPQNLLSWLQECPGTRQTLAGAQALRDGHFDILPGGGAVFAEMTISEGGTKVVIRTYWS